MIDMIVLGISIAILILLFFARAYIVRKDFERWKKNLYALHTAYKTLDEKRMAREYLFWEEEPYTYDR